MRAECSEPVRVAAMQLRRNQKMRKLVAYLLTVSLALFGSFLLATSNQTSVHAQEAAPELNRIGPDTIAAGSPTFTIRLKGANFADGATVLLDDAALDSSRTSSKGKVLLADIDESVIANPGTHTIQAVNPDGMRSATLTLTVVEPDPDIEFQLEGNAAEEDLGFGLVVGAKGDGFNENTAVLIYGSESPNIAINSKNSLDFEFSGDFLKDPARVPVMARNRGGRYSKADIFFVVPAPAILRVIDPDSVEVGTEDFDLTIRGDNFKDNAQIVINGEVIPTTTQKAGRLEAIVPGRFREQPGELIVRIVQDGVQSRDAILLVAPTNDPFITSLAPAVIRQGEKKPRVNITGANFGNKVTVLLDGEEANVKQSTRRTLVVAVDPVVNDVGVHTLQVIDENGVVSEIVSFRVVADVAVTTLAGAKRDGFNNGETCVTTEEALFRRPRRLAFGPDGLLYVTDQQNHAIRTIDFNADQVCTLVGTGFPGYSDSNNTAGFEPSLSYPNGVVVADDGTVYVSENGNNVIRRIRRNGDDTVTVDTFAGENQDVTQKDRQKELNATLKGVSGFRDGDPLDAAFRKPDDMVIAPDGSLYVADSLNHAIRRISLQGNNTVVETIAGNGVPGFADGVGTAARLNTPTGLALSLDGTRLFVADTGNRRIRAIDLVNGNVSTFAGSGNNGGDNGSPGQATFQDPIGIAVDSDGTLYVSEFSANRIRRIDPQGNVSSLAGTGKSKKLKDGAGSKATFNGPRGLAIDRANGILYVADYENFRIRAITLR